MDGEQPVGTDGSPKPVDVASVRAIVAEVLEIVSQLVAVETQARECRRREQFASTHDEHEYFRRTTTNLCRARSELIAALADLLERSLA